MINNSLTGTIYQGISYITTPILYVWLLFRRINHKEDKTRFLERLGYSTASRPNGQLIWAHAASIGECLSILPLLNLLQKKDLHILLTSGTVTSAKILDKRLPKDILHQYVPIDNPGSVNRFLDRWHPDMVIWVESELWPNLITKTAARSIPMLLVNARMSERAYKRWINFPSLISNLLNSFQLILAQSDTDIKRLESLGAKEVKLCKNLKYDAPPLPINKIELGLLINYIDDRPRWLAASTHREDEKIVIDAHCLVAKEIPNLLTIIAPRHPNRTLEIQETLRKRGLTIATRSCEEQIMPDTDIYIADTLGEMGTLYCLSNIAFIGGSFGDHGGHNPIEPALLENSIIAGLDMSNFESGCKSLDDASAITRVTDALTLGDTLKRLLTNNVLSKQKADAAMDAAKLLGGGTTNALYEIERILDGLPQETNVRT